jgi:hypothetical protein
MVDPPSTIWDSYLKMGEQEEEESNLINLKR